MTKIYSRLGDGWVTELTEAELMKDIVDGTQAAADNAKIDVLSDDTLLMREVREDHKIGFITSRGGHPKGMEAKHHIARLLDIDINSVKLFKSRCR